MAPHTLTNTKYKLISAFTILVAVLILTFFISLGLGQYHITVPEILQVFSHKWFGTDVSYASSVETVLWKVRIPRILAALFIGAALASAGATYQGLFQNPMVSPDLLGAASGAGFGAAFALLMDWNSVEVQISAFVCGLVAVTITYLVSTTVSRGTNSTLSLVLTGMVISTLFSSFISIIKYVADPNSKLPEIAFWLMGGLTSMGLEDLPILIIPILLGVIPLIVLRYRLNILSFGEDEAKALGVDTRKMRLLFIICSTLVTSASVAAGGMIGWVGLVIPHLARMLVGPNYKTLLPVSLLMGAIYLMIIDNIARCLFTLEIPLGILTSIIGAPFFLYLLIRGKRGWV